MGPEATAIAFPPPQPSWPAKLGRSLVAIATPVVVISLVLMAWVIHRDAPYASKSAFGYWLGVCGGSMMLVLLIYPLRKRFQLLAFLGPLKHWFRFHLVAGIAGPAIVLFHSAFRVGSFNAGIALACMLLVVASGLVGRFIYRKIHHGLYGCRASAAALQQEVESQMAALQGLLVRMPPVDKEIRSFSTLASLPPQGRWRRGLYFLTLGGRRYLSCGRVHRAIAMYDGRLGGGPRQRELLTLAGTIDDTLSAIQRTAQFSTYERLFSIWHVLHLPFLLMLLVTAIVHVVAVHAY